MKRGICLTSLYPEAIEDSGLLIELFHKVCGTGIFDCVEFYFNGTETEEKRIGYELKKSGLSSVFLGGYPMKRDGIDISAESELRRKESVEMCKALYRHARRMRVDKMLILSGPAWKEKDEEGIIRQTQKSLLEIGEMIMPTGPEVTLEYFNDMGEPWLAVGDIPMVRKIFSSMNLLPVGITFDTSHTAQLKTDIIEAFVALKPWIGHVHLANSVSIDSENPLFGDKHPLFEIENGDFPLEKIKEIYEKLESKGLLEKVDICSFEIISRGNEEQYFEKMCKEAAYVWNI